jgi:hypothetical protein
MGKFRPTMPTQPHKANTFPIIAHRIAWFFTGPATHVSKMGGHCPRMQANRNGAIVNLTTPISMSSEHAVIANRVFFSPKKNRSTGTKPSGFGFGHGPSTAKLARPVAKATTKASKLRQTV